MNGDAKVQEASRNGEARARRMTRGQAKLLERSAYHPNKRHIPSSVQRLVRRRAGDCCEFPGCRNDTFLQFCHIVAHRHGGDRSERNIVLLCSRHHVMLDAGLLRFLGWQKGGADSLSPIEAVFEDAFGQRIAASRTSLIHGPP